MAVIAAGPRAPDHARSARWMWTLLALAALTRLLLLLRGAGASHDESRDGVNGLSLFQGEFPVYFPGLVLHGRRG